jgi:LacI family transcriptional regulator
MPRKRHIVFLQDLSSHSDREVCLGAAEYAAARPDWSFDPWPVSDNLRNGAFRKVLTIADGILTTEKIDEHLFAGQYRRVPRVLFLTDVAHRGVPSASLDELSIGKMAAEHLYSRGYRHLAFIGSSEWRWSKARRKGFVPAALQKQIQPLVREFPLREVPVFWSGNVKRRNESLHRMLDSLPRPCGIFAANDVIACFVVQSIREQGCRVPEDFGVLGVDDDPVPNAAAGLALSSIRPDFREVGRQAARLLDDLLQKKSAAPRVLIPPVCVAVRASTDGFMTDDPLVSRAQHYIETRRQERLLVGDVIRALGTNRVTLGKKFQRHLDVGLQEYILSRRVEYASDLLREGGTSVEKVADICGFSSSSYFSRVFKKVAQRSPGSVRRKRYS